MTGWRRRWKARGESQETYATLFLERFVEPGVSWIHVDTFGWNASDRPGRPEGGEVRGLFAFFHLATPHLQPLPWCPTTLEGSVVGHCTSGSRRIIRLPPTR